MEEISDKKTPLKRELLAHPPRLELEFYAPEAYVLSIELWVQ